MGCEATEKQSVPSVEGPRWPLLTLFVLFFNKGAVALSSWLFKQLAAVQKKITEELSELHRAWKGLSRLPAVSLLLISCSLPLAAQATSFVHVVHVPVLLFAGCTAVTQFCVFTPFRQ